MVQGHHEHRVIQQVPRDLLAQPDLKTHSDQATQAGQDYQEYHWHQGLLWAQQILDFLVNQQCLDLL